jgi:Tol biopolymer transport system component
VTPNLGLLYVVDDDGTNLRKLTTFFARHTEEDPQRAPDGEKVAFARAFDCAAPPPLSF